MIIQSFDKTKKYKAGDIIKHHGILFMCDGTIFAEYELTNNKLKSQLKPPLTEQQKSENKAFWEMLSDDYAKEGKQPDDQTTI